MKIYKYEYDEDVLASDRAKEYGGFIANELFLWGFKRNKPEKTKVYKTDKEVICDRDI